MAVSRRQRRTKGCREELSEEAFEEKQWQYEGSRRSFQKCAPPRLRRGTLRCVAADCGAIGNEDLFKECLDAAHSKRRKKTLRCNDCVAKQKAAEKDRQMQNLEHVSKRRKH